MKYAGIGSRETPGDVLERMADLGHYFAAKGYVLRSGAADGADAAFERGCDRGEGRKQIFLPWDGFNGRHRERDRVFAGAGPNAMAMAERFHPAWGRCSRGARALHARNCYQIFGPRLDDPVNFVVCWTRDGGLTGGTAQAMRIAIHHRVPIYNLFDAESFDHLMKDFG